MSAKPARGSKPTVFLSHSSQNRRELLALKTFLSERSGGMIEYFLSSDDVSIAHGKIWPSEIGKALIRMKLMFVFVSPDALKAPWTYFEAGFGLSETGTANIYCLPGTQKGSLPSPFSILQARNLHSARELSLLIRQVNERLGASLDENVTRQEFDRIFKKPALGMVETGPRLDELVELIVLQVAGPADSEELFKASCKTLNHQVSVADGDHYSQNEWCSTGVRIRVEQFYPTDLASPIKITKAMRESDSLEVVETEAGWELGSPPFRSGIFWSIAQAEAYNASVPEMNEAIARKNAEGEAGPRACTFTVAPLDLSVPIKIVDAWLEAGSVKESPRIEIQLVTGTKCETRREFLGARVHGSHLSLLGDGQLLWMEKVSLAIVLPRLGDGTPSLKLTAQNEAPLKFADFHLEELIGTLAELQVISSKEKSSARKRQ